MKITTPNTRGGEAEQRRVGRLFRMQMTWFLLFVGKISTMQFITWQQVQVQQQIVPIKSAKIQESTVRTSHRKNVFFFVFSVVSSINFPDFIAK